MEVIKDSRIFKAHSSDGYSLKDCGRIYLEPDELITIVSPNGHEHDITAKSWGLFSTPSVNRRLKEEGFSVCLIKGHAGRVFVLSVDDMDKFLEYQKSEGFEVLEWISERK